MCFQIRSGFRAKVKEQIENTQVGNKTQPVGENLNIGLIYFDIPFM